MAIRLLIQFLTMQYHLRNQLPELLAEEVAITMVDNNAQSILQLHDGW